MNPALRGADGRFNLNRGAALKLGGVAAVALAQWGLGRKHPAALKGLALGNLAVGGAYAAVAARNWKTR